MKKNILQITITLTASLLFAQAPFVYNGPTSLCGTNKTMVQLDNIFNFTLPNNVYYTLYNVATGKRIDSSVATSPVQMGAFSYNLSFTGQKLEPGLNTLSILGFEANVAYKVPNNSITVDGFLNEPYRLVNTLAFPFSCTGCSINVLTTPSNAVNFGLLWDDNNLYLAVQVIDNTPSTSQNIIDPTDSNNDNIEIYLDPYNWRSNYFPFVNGGSPNPALREQVVRQITVGYLSPQNNFRLSPTLHTAPGGNLPGLQTATRTITGSGLKYNRNDSNDMPKVQSGTGYIIEFAIPWSTFFNVTTVPAVGFSFGFDIANNDNQGNLTRSEQSMWGRTTSSQSNDGANGSWSTSLTWGTITLVGANTNPVANLGSFDVYGNVSTPLTGAISVSGTCATSLSFQAPSNPGKTMYWLSDPVANTTISGAVNPLVLNDPITTSNVYVAAYDATFGCWTPAISYNVIPDATSIPTPTQTVSCEVGVVTVSGTPAIGTAWFWQTSATGTTTSSPATAAFTLKQSGTTYIRAQQNQTQCWSQSAPSVAVTVNTLPAPPSNVIINEAVICSTATLSAGTATSPVVTYLQLSEDGTSQDIAFAPNVLITASGTYFARNLNTLTGCWNKNILTPPGRLVSLTGPDQTPISVSGPAAISSVAQEFEIVGPSSGVTYQWSAATIIDIQPVTGSYSRVTIKATEFVGDTAFITVSGSGACGQGASFLFKYPFNKLNAVSNVTASRIVVYPNPAPTGASVTIEANGLEAILIADATGSEVQSLASLHGVASVQGLAKGFYLVTLQINGSKQIRKLVIE